MTNTHGTQVARVYRDQEQEARGERERGERERDQAQEVRGVSEQSCYSSSKAYKNITIMYDQVFSLEFDVRILMYQCDING
jgi:hypothetical protein